MLMARVKLWLVLIATWRTRLGMRQRRRMIYLTDQVVIARRAVIPEKGEPL